MSSQATSQKRRFQLKKIISHALSSCKPISDLGRCTYLSYWKYKVLRKLAQSSMMPDLNTLSRQTGFKVRDLILTLKTMNALQKISTDPPQYRISVLLKDIKSLVNSNRFKHPVMLFDRKMIV